MKDMHDAAQPSSQNAYARFAGFMYLVVTTLDVLGAIIISRVAGTGSSIDISHSIAASETLYRIGLSCVLVGNLATILLAVGLYVTVKPADGNLAMTALLFRLAESAIGGVVAILGFATLQIYLAASHTTVFNSDQLGAIAGVVLQTSAIPTGFASVISVIFSMAGSAIFFYVFFKSKYIPRVLAAWGLLDSLLCMVAFVASLIVPQSSALLLTAGGLPIGIAEIGTGLWLLIRGIKSQTQVSHAVVGAA